MTKNLNVKLFTITFVLIAIGVVIYISCPTIKADDGYNVGFITVEGEKLTVFNIKESKKYTITSLDELQLAIKEKE